LGKAKSSTTSGRLTTPTTQTSRFPDFMYRMQRHTHALEHVFTYALLHSSRAPLRNMCVRSRTRRVRYVPLVSRQGCIYYIVGRCCLVLGATVR
jgi:hypothetical protein